MVEFARLPGPADWKRFNKYSRRVRRLFVLQDYEPLHSSIFDDVGRTRTTLNILPNLHTFKWIGMNALLNQSAFNSVVLMHDGIKEFALSIGTLPINTMFQEIVTRMPLLTHLDLRLHVPMHSVELEALELFRGLLKLQVVILPNYHLTANVIQELSRLPDLGVVQFEYGGTQGFGDPSDVHVFDPRLEDGAFPALWDLSLTARLIDMDCFMNAPFAPINITSLY